MPSPFGIPTYKSATPCGLLGVVPASRTPSPPPPSSIRSRSPRLIAVAALLLMGSLSLVVSRPIRKNPATEPEPAAQGAGTADSDASAGAAPPADLEPIPTDAEAAVRRLQIRFLSIQRRRLQEYAAFRGIAVPRAALDFLAAAERRDFDGLKRLYLAFFEENGIPDLPEETRHALRPWITEVFGVEEQLRGWPAAALLEYGRRVLDSIPAGAVYLGGTDEGRFIPTFLNTTAAEPGIVLTQNGLADGSYREYVRFLLGDRVQLPNAAQVDAAFARVLEEQGQTGPDGRRTMGGGRAVMAINDLLVRAIADLNPDLRFAVQESGPMPSTYPGASLNGDLYQFGVPVLGPTDSELAAMAASAAERWSAFAAQLAPSADPSGTDRARTAAAQLISGQASVLQARGLDESAWNLYGIALRVSPGSHGLRVQLATGLIEAGRYDTARQVLDSAPVGYTSGHEALDRLRALLPPGRR